MSDTNSYKTVAFTAGELQAVHRGLFEYRDLLKQALLLPDVPDGEYAVMARSLKDVESAIAKVWP